MQRSADQQQIEHHLRCSLGRFADHEDLQTLGMRLGQPATAAGHPASPQPSCVVASCIDQSDVAVSDRVIWIQDACEPGRGSKERDGGLESAREWRCAASALLRSKGYADEAMWLLDDRLWTLSLVAVGGVGLAASVGQANDRHLEVQSLAFGEAECHHILSSARILTTDSPPSVAEMPLLEARSSSVLHLQSRRLMAGYLTSACFDFPVELSAERMTDEDGGVGRYGTNRFFSRRVFAQKPISDLTIAGAACAGGACSGEAVLPFCGARWFVGIVGCRELSDASHEWIRSVVDGLVEIAEGAFSLTVVTGAAPGADQAAMHAVRTGAARLAGRGGPVQVLPVGSRAAEVWAFLPHGLGVDRPDLRTFEDAGGAEESEWGTCPLAGRYLSGVPDFEPFSARLAMERNLWIYQLGSVGTSSSGVYDLKHRATSARSRVTPKENGTAHARSSGATRQFGRAFYSAVEAESPRFFGVGGAGGTCDAIGAGFAESWRTESERILLTRDSKAKRGSRQRLQGATFVAQVRYREGGAWHGAVTALRKQLPVIVHDDGSLAAAALIQLGAVPLRLTSQSLEGEGPHDTGRVGRRGVSECQVGGLQIGGGLAGVECGCSARPSTNRDQIWEALLQAHRVRQGCLEL